MMVFRILIPILILIFSFNVVTARIYYVAVIKRRSSIIRYSYQLINLILFAAIGLLVYSMARGSDLFSPDRYMVYLVYYYLLFFLPQLIFILFLGISKLAKDNAGVIRGLGSITATFLFATMIWGHYVTARTFDIKEYTVSSPKIPDAFNNYRIVQFSDLHIGNFDGETGLIQSLIDSINHLNPDLILFTGDLVTYHSKEVLPFRSQLSSLRAKDGVYAVLGNHDYSEYHRWKNDDEKDADFRLFKREVAGLGWKLLNNDAVRLTKDSSSIILAGMENWGEPPFPTHGDLEKSLKQINPSANEFILLMSHNPEFWRHHILNQRTDIDLTLSGHTHSMQMKIDLAGKSYSPASMRYPLWGGMHKDSLNNRILINEGIGNVFYPMRVGAKPEISVITLTR
ncbi:MAG: metallophosphoesterase [Bacteroidales bacterium]